MAETLAELRRLLDSAEENGDQNIVADAAVEALPALLARLEALEAHVVELKTLRQLDLLSIQQLEAKLQRIMDWAKHYPTGMCHFCGHRGQGRDSWCEYCLPCIHENSACMGFTDNWTPPKAW